MDNRYHRHNRRKYSLKVHIVLVTKYRKQLLKGDIDDAVKRKIQSIADARHYEIIAMETDEYTPTFAWLKSGSLLFLSLLRSLSKEILRLTRKT